MVSIRPKAIVNMKMSGSCPTHARCDVSVRDVTSIIDEPEARGGTNLGLTPTETLVAALVGCTNVITNRIAEREHIEIEALKIDADTNFDRRGASLEAEIEVPFVSITLNIDLTTGATAEKIAVLKRDLGRYCPISKTLEASGCKITEVWNVKSS